MIKRLILYAIIVVGFTSCASMQKGDFLNHDTMYKNNAHMIFSWWGYKSPSVEDHRKSVSQDWWGEEVPE